MQRAIEIADVTKRYFIGDEERDVVSHLTLAIPPGTVFGFLGPNGAGKTTTIKMLVGLTHADAGSIRVLGDAPDAMAVRSRIGFMPEGSPFYAHLTAPEFLDFAGQLFGMDAKARRAKADVLLAQVNLAGVERLHIRAYSKGMAQRLGLAQALINDPAVLFLDEPFDGLDPLGRVEAKRLLLALKRDGKTIFFNSHILADAEELCDRVGIIDQGRLISEGAVADVRGAHRTLEDAFVETVLKARTHI